MELRFLGKTYTASNNQVETEVLQETGRFLGRSYNLHRPIIKTRSQLVVRKYRGVVYGT